MSRAASIPIVFALLVGCTRPEPAPAAIPKSVDAGAPKIDGGASALAPPSPLPGTMPVVVGVTRDGRRALVRFDDLHGHVAPPPYRFIDVATNTLVDQFELPALGSIPFETMTEGATPSVRANPALTAPALEAEIAKYAAALLSLDEPHDERFAVGGDSVVFNVGDWLNVADARTGKVGARLSRDASYYPQITPRGTAVVYSREQGLLDGVVGNYMPFIAPLPAGVPSRRLEVRDVDGESMRISPDGVYLYVQSGHELPDNGCLVRVTLAPPSATKSLFCVAAGERIDGVRFSPSRTFAVVLARTGRVGPVRATWLHLPDGAKLGELQMSSAFQVGAVDDLGVGVAGGMAIASDDTALLEPVARRYETLTTGVRVPPSFYGAAWLSGDRFVVGQAGGIRVVDLASPKTPHTTHPWPTGPFVAPAPTVLHVP